MGGSEFSGLGFRVEGCRGLGFRGLGFRVKGMSEELRQIFSNDKTSPHAGYTCARAHDNEGFSVAPQ